MKRLRKKNPHLIPPTFLFTYDGGADYKRRKS
jgi:hypothetical protein